MAISFAHEGRDLITLKALAASIPGRVDGQSMTYETVRQWAERGRRGVVLETLLVGGTRMTTRRAFDRFLTRLNHRTGPSGGGADDRIARGALTPRQRREKKARISSQLKDLGVIE